MKSNHKKSEQSQKDAQARTPHMNLKEVPDDLTYLIAEYLDYKDSLKLGRLDLSSRSMFSVNNSLNLLLSRLRNLLGDEDAIEYLREIASPSSLIPLPEDINPAAKLADVTVNAIKEKIKPLQVLCLQLEMSPANAKWVRENIIKLKLYPLLLRLEELHQGMFATKVTDLEAMNESEINDKLKNAAINGNLALIRWLTDSQREAKQAVLTHAHLFLVTQSGSSMAFEFIANELLNETARTKNPNFMIQYESYGKPLAVAFESGDERFIFSVLEKFRMGNAQFKNMMLDKNVILKEFEIALIKLANCNSELAKKVCDYLNKHTHDFPMFRDFVPKIQKFLQMNREDLSWLRNPNHDDYKYLQNHVLVAYSLWHKLLREGVNKEDYSALLSILRSNNWFVEPGGLFEEVLSTVPDIEIVKVAHHEFVTSAQGRQDVRIGEGELKSLMMSRLVERGAGKSPAYWKAFIDEFDLQPTLTNLSIALRYKNYALAKFLISDELGNKKIDSSAPNFVETLKRLDNEEIQSAIFGEKSNLTLPGDEVLKVLLSKRTMLDSDMSYRPS